MYFLIVTAVFPPEPGITGKTSAHIAAGLVRRGHEVVVFSPFPSRPAGKLYPGFTRKLWTRTAHPEGFTLVRCFSFVSVRSTLLSRFCENVSFGLTSGVAALTMRRPDAIYLNTWPVFAAGILYRIARLRRVRVVTSVQDVYPESIIVQGRIRREGLAARLLRRVDRSVARGSRAVIVPADSFARIYRQERTVPASRLHVVPNWAEDNPSDRPFAPFEFRTTLGVPTEAFLVLYGGNIGPAAGVEILIDAFALLRQREEIHLVVGGAGPNLEHCRTRARDQRCARLTFHSPWPEVQTSALLGAADLLILPTRGDQSTASMPSKLASYMLAGRPILALAVEESDLAKMVRRAGCGWVVPPDHPELLAAKIAQVSRMDGAARQKYGDSGRSFALANLAREVCLPRIIDILEAAARRNSQGAPAPARPELTHG